MKEIQLQPHQSNARMLELKSDKAADYLLDKLEDFLMGISK